MTIIPVLQPLETTDPLSVSVDTPVLDVSYAWGHTTQGIWCLASRTQRDGFEVHPHCTVRQDLVPLCG